ncbi:YXWGXW repeat-containing protein [Candidatus Pacearchaeota archaeon]|nr:YXWGXW repeat-containing protein [Candidatus Pacearchaeota archaeon]
MAYKWVRRWVPGYYRYVGRKRVWVSGHYTSVRIWVN